VTSSNLDIHLPASRGLARLKAKAVVGQCGLTADDREDIEAQLLLAFCSRVDRFNSERSSLATFTCRVMDREVASILRYRLAQRRLQLGLSLSMVAPRIMFTAHRLPLPNGWSFGWTWAR
jgi:hypothetical protein